MTTIEQFIHGLPKLELHLHIEGTLTPELKVHLSKRNNLPTPSASEIRSTYKFNSLSSFLKLYYDGMRVLLQPEDFYDLGMDYLRKAASQNVRYVELFFDPQAHTGRGVPFRSIMTGLTRACDEGRNTLGIEARLIMCFLRDHEAEWAEDILTQSLEFKEFILGVGLDSDEHENPPIKFQRVFERARREGYRLTMHCDVDQLNSLQHVAQVLDVIQVDRIDHGVNIAASPALIDRLRKIPGMGLTVCPVSNGFVTGDMCEARIRRLLEGGVRVTINSDDPSYMGEKYVEENLVELARSMGLSREEVVKFQMNAVEICWADGATKKKLEEEIDTYLRANS